VRALGSLRLPPGPSSAFRTAAALRRDPLGFVTEAQRRFGDVARIPLWHRTFYLVSHPDGVRHVLIDNARNYGKDTATFSKLRSLFGAGLLTSDGEDWLRRRRIAQPAFGRERLAAIVPVVVQATAAMIARWSAQGPEPIDAAREMTRLTLEIVVAALLGGNLGEGNEQVAGAVSEIVHQTKRRIESLIDLSAILPTLSNLRARRARRLLDRVVDRLVTRPAGEGTDLLARLRQASEAQGRGALRDEVMTMFVAGHETTANLLTWTLYEIARNPCVGRRAAAESREVLAGRAPGWDDLAPLAFTKRVLQESMRLHPPVWLVERSAKEDDMIGGCLIPAGATVAVSQYVTHRRPGCWREPERFDPDRFTPERLEGLPRCAFFPFGGGAQQCIGGQFAMMEAQIVLAMVAQSCAVGLVNDRPVEADAGVTLRPREPIPLSIRLEVPHATD